MEYFLAREELLPLVLISPPLHLAYCGGGKLQLPATTN